LSLDHEEHRVLPLWSFQGAQRAIPLERTPAGGRSLKTQQRGASRSTFGLGELEHRTSGPKSKHRRVERPRELELPHSLERR